MSPLKLQLTLVSVEIDPKSTRKQGVDPGKGALKFFPQKTKIKSCKGQIPNPNFIKRVQGR